MRPILLALVVLLALAPAAAAHTDYPRPSETGFLKTEDGVEVYFERYGDGPQLVIAPNRLYMPEFAGLARPGRTLVLYDMRNRGRSMPVADDAKVTIDGDLRDLRALHLRFGGRPAALIGYSYLGLMVALYASEHPADVARLVQIGAVPPRWDTPYPADLRGSASTLDPDGKAAWAALEAAQGSSSGEAALCALQHRAFSYWLVGDPRNAGRIPDVCGYDNELPARSERHLTLHFGDIQKRTFPRSLFERLPAPVLVVHGRLDRNAAYGAGLDWARTFPDARLITVPGGAHQVWLDDPAVLVDIDRFLAGEWPARAAAIRP